MIGRRRCDRRYEGIPDELAGTADRPAGEVVR